MPLIILCGAEPAVILDVVNGVFCSIVREFKIIIHNDAVSDIIGSNKGQSLIGYCFQQPSGCLSGIRNLEPSETAI
jgi:hypothetical protein